MQQRYAIGNDTKTAASIQRVGDLLSDGSTMRQRIGSPRGGSVSSVKNTEATFAEAPFPQAVVTEAALAKARVAEAPIAEAAVTEAL